MEFDPNGFPVPFLQRMERMLGSEYPAFLERFALGSRHHGLRVNPLKLSPQEFLSRHGEARHGNMFARGKVRFTRRGFTTSRSRARCRRSRRWM